MRTPLKFLALAISVQLLASVVSSAPQSPPHFPGKPGHRHAVYKTNGNGSFSMFQINNNSSDYTATDCSNLDIWAHDDFFVYGYVDNTYKLVKDGVTIQTQSSGPYILFGLASFAPHFMAPPDGGSYTITRTPGGPVSTNAITVTYPASLNCTPPTCFEVTTLGDDMWFGGVDAVHQPVVGDFDNDGRVDDIAYLGACGSGSPAWRIHMCDGTGTSVQCWPTNEWITGNDPINQPVVGDFDKDGFMDDIAYYGACGTGGECWRVHIGQKDHFDTTSFGGTFWFNGNDATHAPVVGDFDNDGHVDDIAVFGACGSGAPYWRIFMSNGSSFSVQCWPADEWFEGTDPINQPVVGDFDNDGFKDDIAYFGKCGTGTECWRVHIGQKDHFDTTSWGGDIWFGGTDPRYMPVVGDFDRDGWVDDIAYYGRIGSGGGIPCWRVHLSNGQSFNQIENYCDNAWLGPANWTSRPLAGEFTLDPWTDIVYSGFAGNNVHVWRAHVLR